MEWYGTLDNPKLNKQALPETMTAPVETPAEYPAEQEEEDETEFLANAAMRRLRNALQLLEDEKKGRMFQYYVFRKNLTDAISFLNGCLETAEANRKPL